MIDKYIEEAVTAMMAVEIQEIIDRQNVAFEKHERNLKKIRQEYEQRMIKLGRNNRKAEE